MKIENTLVSIVMPSYNSEQFIAESIESVKAQSHNEWELLICDDCSTDGTFDIAYSLAERDKRIKVFKNFENKGPSESRNRCIDNAKGQYIAFLDSDDLWCNTFLEEQLAFIRNKGVKVVFSSYSRIDESGNKVLQDFIVPEKVSYKDILKTNSISCLSILLKKEVIGDVRMKDLPVEDHNFWLDLLKSHSLFYGNKKVLAKYRIRNGSRSRNKRRLIGRQWETYRKGQRLSFLKSLRYTMVWAYSGIKKYGK